MNDAYLWVSVVLFLCSFCFAMKMIGEVFFILIYTVSVDHFEASYSNPFYGVLDGMIFHDLINKTKINTNSDGN